MAPTRGLLLVDDHTIVREGIKRILEPLGAEWTVHEAANAAQAQACLRQQPFALAIVDLSLPGISGLELIRRIRAEHPALPILVLTMHVEEQYAMRAFRAGAQGFLTKDSAPAELVTAVRRLAEGGVYVSAALAERMVHQLSGAVPAAAHHAELSNRELDVLQRIVAGQRLTDIAEALHLSVKTVSTHKTRIQEKLGLPNTAALIRYGLENQLSPGDTAPTPLDEADSAGA